MAKIEAHLGPKLAYGARAGPVALAHPRRHDVADQVEVLELFVLAAACTGGDLRSGLALAPGTFLDEDLKLILDRVFFFDAIHGFAPCLHTAPRVHPYIPG